MQEDFREEVILELSLEGWQTMSFWWAEGRMGGRQGSGLFDSVEALRCKASQGAANGWVCLGEGWGEWWGVTQWSYGINILSWRNQWILSSFHDMLRFSTLKGKNFWSVDETWQTLPHFSTQIQDRSKIKSGSQQTEIICFTDETDYLVPNPRIRQT